MTKTQIAQALAARDASLEVDVLLADYSKKQLDAMLSAALAAEEAAALDNEVDLGDDAAGDEGAAAPEDNAGGEVDAAADEAKVEELRTRRKVLLEELAALDGQLSQYQNHTLDTSVVQKPVALCRQVFVAMYGQRRRDVVAALVNKGVAANTAKTQFQVLKKKVDNGDAELLTEIEAAAQPVN